MKKGILISIILLFFLILSGCTQKKEVEDLMITTAIALDLTEEGSLEVSVQLLNSNSAGNRPQDVTPVVVVSETGRTIQEALRKVNTIITEKLFFSHFVILVIGEELARKGILPFVAFFAINQETLHRFDILIARGCKGKDVLKIVSVAANIPAMAVEGKLVATTKLYGISKIYTNDEVMSDLRSEGISLTLGSIEIIGDLEEGSDLDNRKTIDVRAYTKVSTLGVFKQDRIIAWLDEEESLGFTYLMGKIKNSYIIVTKGDGTFVSVQLKTCKVKTKLETEGEKIKVKVSINFQGEVVEDLSGETSYDVVYVEDIRQRTEYEIKRLCEKVFSKAQELKADIFGYGRMIYRHKFKLWEEIKDRYEDEIFPEIEAEFTIKGNIIRVKP